MKTIVNTDVNPVIGLLVVLQKGLKEYTRELHEALPRKEVFDRGFGLVPHCDEDFYSDILKKVTEALKIATETEVKEAKIYFKTQFNGTSVPVVEMRRLQLLFV